MGIHSSKFQVFLAYCVLYRKGNLLKVCFNIWKSWPRKNKNNQNKKSKQPTDSSLTTTPFHHKLPYFFFRTKKNTGVLPKTKQKQLNGNGPFAMVFSSSSLVIAVVTLVVTLVEGLAFREICWGETQGPKRSPRNVWVGRHHHVYLTQPFKSGVIYQVSIFPTKGLRKSQNFVQVESSFFFCWFWCVCFFFFAQDLVDVFLFGKLNRWTWDPESALN